MANAFGLSMYYKFNGPSTIFQMRIKANIDPI